jgi:hypothetical protein
MDCLLTDDLDRWRRFLAHAPQEWRELAERASAVLLRSLYFALDSCASDEDLRELIEIVLVAVFDKAHDSYCRERYEPSIN